MDALTVVLLGVIALAAASQAAFLLVAGLGFGRAAGRMTDLAFRIHEHLRPAARELSQAAARAAQTSGVLATESRRLHATLEDAVERVRRAQETLEHAVLPTLGAVASAAAAARWIRSALRLYRRFR